MSKKTLIKFIVFAMILSVSVLCVPGTFAKYSQKDEYNIVISSENMDSVKKWTGLTTNTGSTNPLGAVTATAEKSGYYAIIAKGGNGSAGMYTDSNYLSDNASVGGYFYACVYLNQGDSLTAYIGNAASNPTRADNADSKRHDSNPGINKLEVASGGNSAHLSVPSTKNSSGAGGGATIITKTTSSTVSLIGVAAGGGGGGGADNKAFSIFSRVLTVEGGKGGDGGNISSSDKTTYNGFLVMSGSSGGSSNSSNNGTGGSTSGTLVSISNSTVTGGSGGAGSKFGGGGGGGYACGTGGDGNGCGSAAGGGGGGSSCIATTCSGRDVIDLKTDAADLIVSLADMADSINIANSTFPTGGFVIIAYLNDGTYTSSYSNGTSIAVS